MRRELRITDVNALEPHDHVVWYGDGTTDLYPLASVALTAGAGRNEKLMFVAEDPDPAQLRIADIDRLLGDGQLELQSVSAVYGTSGVFSAAEQLATFEGVLADALVDGYTGIRVVADNTALARGSEEGFRRWLSWEHVTDDFQSRCEVTGVCYFDRGALSEDRQADIAALHAARPANGVEPAFSFFVDGDAVKVTGTLDIWSADQFRRILDATPEDDPLVVDLSGAEFVDHRALLALNDAASVTRPVHVRRAPPTIRELPAMLELTTPHLRFE